MNISKKLVSILVAIIIIVLFLSQSLFTVSQQQQALVLQFGSPIKQITEAGLNYKIPFIQNVEFFDKRVQSLVPDSQEILLLDQKRLIVSAFVLYKINNILEFKKRAESLNNFNLIFATRINANIRAEIAQINLSTLLTDCSLANSNKDCRTKVMNRITENLKIEGKEFGVDVVDVRIVQAELPPVTLDAVYNRMIADRTAQATQLRAEGFESKTKIQAEADREVIQTLSKSNKESEIIRGKAEANRNTILTDATKKYPEFYEFWRSMQAYIKSFASGGTLVSPESEGFLKFFNKNQN